MVVEILPRVFFVSGGILCRFMNFAANLAGRSSKSSFSQFQKNGKSFARTATPPRLKNSCPSSEELSGVHPPPAAPHAPLLPARRDRTDGCGRLPQLSPGPLSTGDHEPDLFIPGRSAIGAPAFIHFCPAAPKGRDCRKFRAHAENPSHHPFLPFGMFTTPPGASSLDAILE